MTGFSDPLAGKTASTIGMNIDTDVDIDNPTSQLAGKTASTTGMNIDTDVDIDNPTSQQGSAPTSEKGTSASHSEMNQAAAESASSMGGVSGLEEDSLIIDETTEGETGEVVKPEELEPPLPPKLSEPPKISTVVDLTVLLSALQLSEQKNQAEKTAEQIKADAKDRSIQYDKQIDQIQDKIKEMNKSGILKLFTKIFSAIGAVLGIIAGALSIAAGVATGGNPLLIVGGVLAMVASIDALMSVASDGKVSISAGITKALEAMGVDPETAGWIAFAIQMAMIVATIAIGFASGGGSTASALANLGSMVSRATKTLTVAESAIQAAASGVGIGKGVVDSGIKENEAVSLEIDGLLKKLQENIGTLQSFFEQQISRLNEMVDSAKDIVEEKAKTMAAIQRGVMS